jgi:Bacterial protein of unknown function (DUF885)/Type II secretion system (T2SS), protein F
MKAIAVLVACAFAAPAAAETFKELAAAEWAWQLAEFPQYATVVGVHDYDDRLEHVDEAAHQRRLAHYRDTAKKLAAMAPTLAGDDAVSARVLAELTRSYIAGIELRRHLMPVNGDSGFYGDLADLPRSQPFRTADDYDRYIRRLAAMATADRAFEDGIEAAMRHVRSGTTLEDALARTQLFDDTFILGVAGGEGAGKLDVALDQQARIIRDSFLHRIYVLVSLVAFVVLVAVYVYVLWRVYDQMKQTMDLINPDKIMQMMGIDGG